MKDDNTEPKWWAQGLAFGILMFIGMSVVFPLITGEGLILKKVLLELPICLICGMFYPPTVYAITLLFNVLKKKK